MTHILVCDDHSFELEKIAAAVKSCYDDINCHINCFDNPHDVLDFLENDGMVDIAFLDIIMPGMTGIELASAMRSLKFSGYLVFLTSVNDFAAESYSVKAFSYLLKPIDPHVLRQLLGDIEKERRESDMAGFSVTRRSSTRFISFAELLYVEVASHNLSFHLESGEVFSVYGSMKDYAPTLLEDPRMAQCHKSFIVNMDYITVFEGRIIVMRNGSRISITNSFKDFKSICYRRMFGKKGNS